MICSASEPWPFPFPCPLPLAWRWAGSAASPRGACSSSNAGAVTLLRTPLKRSRTSADAVGLRASLPLKITSSIRSPRRLLALCSPITHVIASATLLLPHPFGPTIAVTPLSKASSERSENDLNPLMSRRSKRMGIHHAYRPGYGPEPRTPTHILFSGWETDLIDRFSPLRHPWGGRRPRGEKRPSV